MRCDIGTLKLEINFTLNVSCIFLNQQEISLYVIDEIKMNDIFFLYNKKTSFCTNIPLSNSISFYNLHSRLKEVMKHLNPNKHLNGTHISVTSPHFKTVSWKSKAKLCYHNLPPWILLILHACN